MYPTLNSSQTSETELQEGQTPNITPLYQQTEEKKEINIKDYVDIQDNKVVAFILNWIKTTFARDLMEYLNTEFRQSILNEIKKQHATNR